MKLPRLLWVRNPVTKKQDNKKAVQSKNYCRKSKINVKYVKED